MILDLALGAYAAPWWVGPALLSAGAAALCWLAWDRWVR
jgi:hypothetical protein